MAKKSWQLDRRTFLRGAGVALALPYLESMTAAVKAEGTGELPRRLACVFFPNGVSLPPETHHDYERWNWFPMGSGREYQFTQTLESLQPFRQKLSVLGGLSHPSGRRLPGHSVSDMFLTGAPVTSTTYQNAISFDQVAAARLGEHTRLDSLVLSSPGGVGQVCRTRTLSFSANGQPIPAESNLRRTFNLMFGQGQETTQAAQRAQAMRRSMLDLLQEDANSLNRQLGRQDQQRLDEYLSSVRTIEHRVERAEHWMNVPRPNVDPSAMNLRATPEAPLEYIRAVYDLMFLAFQSDTTRVATYLIGVEGGGQPTDFFPTALGLPGHHALTHSATRSRNGYENWAKWDQFLAQQLAHFLGRLNETREGEATLLDRTMVFYGCSTSRTHLARNYPIILAGGNALGVRHGEYRIFPERVPLSNLFVTLLDRLQIPVERFADSTGRLSELVS